MSKVSLEWFLVLQTVEYLANRAANLGASYDDLQEHKLIIDLARDLLAQTCDSADYHRYVLKFSLFDSPGTEMGM